MISYTSIMVEAYRLSTGKSLQDSLAELGIDSLVGSTEIQPLLHEQAELVQALQGDPQGIAKWGSGRGRRP